jgi:hypothetical protein
MIGGPEGPERKGLTMIGGPAAAGPEGPGPALGAAVSTAFPAGSSIA